MKIIIDIPYLVDQSGNRVEVTEDHCITFTRAIEGEIEAEGSYVETDEGYKICSEYTTSIKE
jgi:hypothetical protein